MGTFAGQFRSSVFFFDICCGILFRLRSDIQLFTYSFVLE
jgi:hypothetical protein